MTIRSFTKSQLCLSPLNVRTNREDAEATEALEASIETRGLLVPLIVHPLPPAAKARKPAPDLWGVLAGGRRFRAISRLIAAGRLPADFAIDAVVRDLDPAAITELSLAENFLRRDLRPYEIHAAIARAYAQGASPEDIAAHFGQRLVWVRQHIRLGELAPEIFAAYADGRLAADQAKAYGATADHDLQRAAFAHFANVRSWERDAHSIRAFLKVGDHELARMLAFVGDEAYRAAGGRFELDLFADAAEERGIVTDEALLRKLADLQLDDIRTLTRIAAGDTALRFAAEPPKFGGYIDSSLEFHPPEHGDGDDGGADRRLVLPDGDIVATLEIDDRGEALLRWWWASRKARADAEKAANASPDKPRLPAGRPPDPIPEGAGFDRYSASSQAARSSLRDSHGLTAEGVQIMRSLRRELLRALIVDDATFSGTLGRDYVIWSQLRQELTRDASAVTGTRGLASGWTTTADHLSAETLDPYFETMKAHAVWTAALEHIRAERFITLADQGEAFAAFASAPLQTKCVAGAVLAGLALLRSGAADGWAIAAHDTLAELAGGSDIALRDLWAPTPQFLALFPKLQRQAMVQPFVEPIFFAGLQKLASEPLTTQAAEILNSEAATDSWVHPLLSFTDHTAPAHQLQAAADDVGSAHRA